MQSNGLNGLALQQLQPELRYTAFNENILERGKEKTFRTSTYSFRIWSHLLDLVGDRGKTIVITTHYIEEAKQANVVGLLRNGRLLAEDPPQVSQQTVCRFTKPESDF